MNKNILLFLILILSYEDNSAQPNGGFENWTTEFSYEAPDDWQTLNFLSLSTPPVVISAFKAIGSDKHSGNFALKLKTVVIDGNQFPALLGDSIGGAFTGKINFSPFSYKFGYTYTDRPEKLEFWSKYFPVGNDTGAVAVLLQKWNGTGHDTVALGLMSIPSSPVYNFYQLNLAYRLETLPDTAVIAFYPSRDAGVARINSTLFVDDVAFTGWVGINENNVLKETVKVYPNPAKNNITFDVKQEGAETICINDFAGKEFFTETLFNQKININTIEFANGIYFYEVKDKNGKVLCRGRFCITQ